MQYTYLRKDLYLTWIMGSYKSIWKIQNTQQKNEGRTQSLHKKRVSNIKKRVLNSIGIS